MFYPLIGGIKDGKLCRKVLIYVNYPLNSGPEDEMSDVM